MPPRDIVVVGTSAGGVEALKKLVGGLPPDYAGSLFIVVHVNPLGTSILPQILTRAGRLQARHPDDRDPIEPGVIYVAPPDYHLLIERDVVRVVRGPKENRHRPAADPLFRTAARAYGPRVAGVVLTGALDDGAAGLLAVKSRGGVAIVQDPEEAPYPDMPRNAARSVDVDHCLGLAEIAPLLARLAAVRDRAKELVPATGLLEMESRVALEGSGHMDEVEKMGKPSSFTCPECHGTLWEIHDAELLRFRCHVGHGFSAESLLTDQSEALEDALWAALRALEENVELSERMAARARSRADRRSEDDHEQSARRLADHARVLRDILANGDDRSASTKHA
jgi:two-component system chemotaxis response regulator CheB